MVRKLFGKLFCLAALLLTFTLATVPAHATVGTCTLVTKTNDVSQFTVVAVNDADTGATCAHTMGANPVVIITPILQAPAALSAWAATTISSTSVVLAKGTGAGSGNASAQISVFVIRNR